MNVSTVYRAHAYNNAWANYRLLTACETLDASDLAATRTSFFPSIIQTLNHILIVDWFYVSALEGDCLGPAAFEPEVPCPAFDDLAREQTSIDRRLIAVCEDLSEARLDEVVRMPRTDWVQEQPAGRVLLHLFQHQVHHRGQVHAMLSGTRAAPPQLDEFFLGGEKEYAYRAGDFDALGFSEQHVWQSS